MTSECSLSQEAYAKIVLHALKYPSQAVNGVLIGRLAQESDTASLAAELLVVDAVPLFHSHLGLAPMLELALSQVDEFCSSSAGNLSIVGYYHANERVDDRDFGSVAKKIASKIESNFPQACALLVDNSKLPEVQKGTAKAHTSALQVYRNRGGSWQRSSGAVSLKEPMAGEVVARLIQEERYRKLWDFEDHLLDISRDWLNASLLK